jgi:hypothetical protein
MMRFSWLICGMAIVALGLPGCGGGGGTTVTGSVMLNGAPLAGADVSFAGDSQSKLGGFSTKTDGQGKFEIRSGTRPAVIQPGTYRVMISKFVDKKGQVPNQEDYEQLKAAGMLRDLVPRKYNDPAESVLTAEIKAGANDLPPFDLKGPKLK